VSDDESECRLVDQMACQSVEQREQPMDVQRVVRWDEPGVVLRDVKWV
jgi:hypothetical protein